MEANGDGMISASFFIPAELLEKIKAVAKQEDKNASQLVRQVFSEALGLAYKEEIMDHKSAFIRTLTYFETADLREAIACHDAATNVLHQRKAGDEAEQPKPRRGRKPKVNGGEAAESLADA